MRVATPDPGADHDARVVPGGEEIVPDLPVAGIADEDHGVKECLLELLRTVRDGGHLAEQVDIGLAQVEPPKCRLGDVLRLTPRGPFALQPGLGPGQLAAEVRWGTIAAHGFAAGQVNRSSQWSPPRCSQIGWVTMIVSPNRSPAPRARPSAK